jgi:hypothetical protein
MNRFDRAKTDQLIDDGQRQSRILHGAMARVPIRAFTGSGHRRFPSRGSTPSHRPTNPSPPSAMQDLHLPPYLTLELIGAVILPVLSQQAPHVLSNPCGDQTVRARRTGGIHVLFCSPQTTLAGHRGQAGEPVGGDLAQERGHPSDGLNRARFAEGSILLKSWSLRQTGRGSSQAARCR